MHPLLSDFNFMRSFSNTTYFCLTVSLLLSYIIGSICIWDMPKSNFDRDTDEPIFIVLLSSCNHIMGQCIKLGHDRFPAHLCQMIMPCHPLIVIDSLVNSTTNLQISMCTCVQSLNQIYLLLSQKTFTNYCRNFLHRKFKSPWTRRRVDWWIDTDVSEELDSFIFRVKEVQEDWLDPEEYVIITVFYINNGYEKAPRYHVILILPVLFTALSIRYIPLVPEQSSFSVPKVFTGPPVFPSPALTVQLYPWSVSSPTLVLLQIATLPWQLNYR
jgi:hypothetical protein